MQKALRTALFAGVVLLAAYLRLTGLSWGLSSGYGLYRNFQSDEFVSLRGVLQIDLLAGRLEAPGAYFEGTFNYYLWAVPKALLKISNAQDTGLGDRQNVKGHADLLYICRWMSVLFDLAAIVIVFLAISEATQKFYPSLMGALCYAILPMEVIYAHFMRPHILSNLLCALVIWLSLKLRKSKSWQMLFAVGLCSGLGAATRYPVGIIVVIPCLYLLLNDRADSQNETIRSWERVKLFVAGPIWLIGLGFVVGLFLGHPMLFLNPLTVIKAITGQTLKYATLQQFSLGQLVNLSVVWRYITYLIPFAMYPVLWLVPYAAISYLVFRRSLYSQSVPILIFSFLYLYFMGKGYLALGQYDFARETMLLFPGFCVLVGIASSDLHLRLRNRRIGASILASALVVILGPTVVFDIAYGHAMQQKDAREALRDDLQKLIGESRAIIGISRFAPYFYTVTPATEPLKSDKVTVHLQDAGENADFFLLGLPTEINPVQLNAAIRAVEAQGKFKYEKSYCGHLKIFGHEFGLVRFPVDMTFPFPTILLFRARVQT